MLVIVFVSISIKKSFCHSGKTTWQNDFLCHRLNQNLDTFLFKKVISPVVLPLSKRGERGQEKLFTFSQLL
jgi:hypothetical protein